MTAALDPNARVWQDKKRYLWLMGLIVPTLLLTVLPFVWAMNQAGWKTASQVLFWIGPILLYILLPILDLRFGADGQNPPDEVMEWLENDKYYRYCTYIYIPFQYASVVLGAGFTGPLPGDTGHEPPEPSAGTWSPRLSDAGTEPEHRLAHSSYVE